MTKTAFLLTLCLILLSFDASSQVNKKASRPKPSKPAMSGQLFIPADYEYRFYLDRKGQLSCTVLSVSYGKFLAPTDTTSAMNAIFSSGAEKSLFELIRPRIVLEAEPSVDMLKVLDTLGSLRVSGDQQIELGLPDGINLLLSKLPTKSPGPMFPNPLRLVVRLGEGKKMTLNNESVGTYPDVVKLSDQLARIFKEREANGVLQSGTNDIEKTISIVIPMSGYRFSDLIDVGRDLDKAGVKPLILDIDSYDDKMLDLTTPPRKK